MIIQNVYNMGMTGNILRVSEEELDAILNDSSILEEIVYDEEVVV